MKKNINRLISDSLWGTISDDDQRYLDQLLEKDQQLRERYQQLLKRKDLVKRYQLYNSIEPYEGSSSEQPESEGKNRFVDFLRGSLPYLRYAAIIIILFVVGSLWLNKNKDERPTAPQLPDEVLATITQAEQSGKNQAVLTIDGQPVKVENEKTIQKIETGKTQEHILTTHHDSEFWLTLDDGTRVHLNYGTTLIYPRKFNGDTREVELEGEAYFFVAKDANHPFVVHTPEGDVKVYGTEFNINTQDDEGTTRIVLVNGSISVTPKGGREQMIRPNEMAVISSGECMFSTVDVAPYVSWNTGMFIFADCPLEKLMRVLSRWYNKRVEFNSDDIRQIEFTGTINKYGDISPALKAIHTVTGLRIEMKKDLIIISKQSY
ncbi:MAG: FecR domain-containing protein [Prevotella sp.]|nr:FecR domain-containing protein [Prevotella sp.]